jgi:hypothetical protein
MLAVLEPGGQPDAYAMAAMMNCIIPAGRILTKEEDKKIIGDFRARLRQAKDQGRAQAIAQLQF